MNRKLYAYQDGGLFYDSRTNEVIGDYEELVANDNDNTGANAARIRFLNEHPGYRIETTFLGMDELLDIAALGGPGPDVMTEAKDHAIQQEIDKNDN